MYQECASFFYRIGCALRGQRAVPPHSDLPLCIPFWNIGHRGAPRHCPENTIVSFERAVALGANAIEADVCFPEGFPVLYHDRNPKGIIARIRRMGAEGLAYVPMPPRHVSLWHCIEDIPLLDYEMYGGYVRRNGLRNGLLRLKKRGALQDYVVSPIFEDLLIWLRDRHLVRDVFLDLKVTPGKSHLVCALFEELQRYPRQMEEITFHILGSLEVIALLMAQIGSVPLPASVRLYADSGFPYGFRTVHALGIRHLALGCVICPWRRFMSYATEAVAARDRGDFDTVIVWTVNNPRKMRELLDVGVNGIITDRPELLSHVLQERSLLI